MRRTAGVMALGGLMMAFALFCFPSVAQRNDGQNNDTAFDVKSVFPREVSPARYEQVDQHELQALAEQGWELVSVTPYVYRNEERGGEQLHPRPIVTQTYPAYFFKRVRSMRGR